MEKAKEKARLAVDIGGTFTDLALEWKDRHESVKVLTTPRAPEEGVLAGVEQILKLTGLQPDFRQPQLARPKKAMKAATERTEIRLAAESWSPPVPMSWCTSP